MLVAAVLALLALGVIAPGAQARDSWEGRYAPSETSPPVAARDSWDGRHAPFETSPPVAARDSWDGRHAPAEPALRWRGHSGPQAKSERGESPWHVPAACSDRPS